MEPASMTSKLERVKRTPRAMSTNPAMTVGETGGLCRSFMSFLYSTVRVERPGLSHDSANGGPPPVNADPRPADGVPARLQSASEGRWGTSFESRAASPHDLSPVSDAERGAGGKL